MTTRWVLKLALVVAAGSMMLSSCGGAAKPASTQLGGPGAVTPQQLLANLTPLERQILADKKVTMGEYDRAVQASVACLRSAGFTVSDPTLAPNGLLMFTSSYSWGERNTNEPPPSAEQAKVDASQVACQAESAAVQAVYILEHAATEQQTHEAFDKMVACFNQLGVGIDQGSTAADLSQIASKVDSAVKSLTITDAQAQVCKDIYQAVSVTPLPGLGDALAQLDI